MGFNIHYTDKKRVVIIGGGFGGLKLAEKLKKSKFQVVLIDKNNYHQFPPLLYQVASSGLEYNEISFPYRKIFQKRKNFYFRLAEVYGVNPKGHTIQTSIGELEYDYLVIAAGTITNFFGNKTSWHRLPSLYLFLAIPLINQALPDRNLWPAIPPEP